VELRQQGFTIALDDFRLTPETETLLQHAQIVKLDVLAHTDSALAEIVLSLRSQHRALALIAEKVETREDFERCRELGFDAFQGYFFARPARVQRDRLPSEGLAALRAMAELNATEDFDELHRIITRDVGLSVRLLRYANSGFVALPLRVGSVHEGLSWLGASTVRRFALMVALAGARDVPSELLVTALVRARMCQLLCGERGAGAEDSSFTVGLFSVADALANHPDARGDRAAPLPRGHSRRAPERRGRSRPTAARSDRLPACRLRRRRRAQTPPSRRRAGLPRGDPMGRSELRRARLTAARE